MPPKALRLKTAKVPLPTKVPFVSIFIETTTSWGRRVVTGIIESSKLHGPWHIELHTGGPNEVFALGKNWKPDGIIGRVPDAEVARIFARKKVPVVNCSGIIVPEARFPTVTGSYLGDATVAAEHFWSKGLSQFAYVGRPEESYVHILYDRFKEVLATRACRCSFHRSMPSPEGYMEWLKQLPKPIGILCWGPPVGHTILDACWKSGINVPHDVAVMACDFDDLQSEASYPEQTGIRTSAEQIGRTAADLLQTLFKGKTPAKMRHEIEPLGIIPRLSTDTLAVPDKQIASVMQFIQNHAHEPISVRAILRREPMARRSLERKFRHFFGRSIVDQIRQTRVNNLRLLLATTETPITTLAENCGFSSYKYMGLVFREATGMSPRAFRDLYRTKSRIKS